MSLPSQQRSFGTRVSRGSRGKAGGSAKLIAGVVLLGTVVGGGWLIFRDSGAATEPAQAGTEIMDPTLASATPQTPPMDDVELVLDEPDGFVETRVVGAEPAGSGPTQAPSQSPNRPTGVLAATTDRAGSQQGSTTTQASSAREIQPTGDLASLMNDARQHLNDQDLVAARDALNSALSVRGATERELTLVRNDLASLNQELFFGPKVYEGDRIAGTYTIESGDSLQGITNGLGLACDWRLIQRINKIQSPNRIRIGQKIKVVQGPFHAVVDKSDYRMDVYAGPPGSVDQWIYIRSFDVGLGEDNSTPVGRFVVRPDSKLINPVWRNPRTGEFFAADDPENPIGEHWLGLEGTGDIAHVEGYGIHGTVEPDSIGRDASMGCIRLAADDIAVVYEMLEESVSEVYIRP